jgi:hypothetical protein
MELRSFAVGGGQGEQGDHEGQMPAEFRSAGLGGEAE